MIQLVPCQHFHYSLAAVMLDYILVSRDPKNDPKIVNAVFDMLERFLIVIENFKHIMIADKIKGEYPMVSLVWDNMNRKFKSVLTAAKSVVTDESRASMSIDFDFSSPFEHLTEMVLYLMLLVSKNLKNSLCIFDLN